MCTCMCVVYMYYVFMHDFSLYGVIIIMIN